MKRYENNYFSSVVLHHLSLCELSVQTIFSRHCRIEKAMAKRQEVQAKVGLESFYCINKHLYCLLQEIV